MIQKKRVKVNQVLEQNIGLLLLLIAIAYLFSMGVRMYWPLHFGDVESMRYAGELMINTNDGYFFATGARDIIDGVVAADRQRASAYHVSPGLVLLTAYLTKFTPLSLDTVTLYLPGIISSLIVIPIILTGRLLGNTLLGFLAALIGSIAWSYYNRTMIGYYDTDMFSVLLQFMIFYSFMKIIYEKHLLAVAFATLWVLIYPLFYSQGLLITYAMFILLVIYMFLEYKGWIKSEETSSFKENSVSLYATVMLLSIALMISLPIELRVIFVIIILLFLIKVKLQERQLLLIALLFFIGFLYFGNIFAVIWTKIFSYADRGLDTGALHFYQVIQTVREAGAIPFETMANRISGSQTGLLFSLVGYILLVFRHKQFIVALPLIGVGIFSLVGGLRFTVYAVPVAAISVVYLFFILSSWVERSINEEKFKKPVKYLFIVLSTVAILYPNIKHIEGYLVPTVLNKTEVEDLVKLDKIASNNDYTIAWWDYGYPIWYYSNTNTIIDGGKHTHDNYIVSKIFFSDSPIQAANLSKLAVETYVDSNYSLIADTLFLDKKKSPNQILNELKSKEYKLPKKSREVFLYLPYRMMRIFSTVSVFGNLNLKTGKAQRRVEFYLSRPVKQSRGEILLGNGIVFDTLKGEINLKGKRKKVQHFDIVASSVDGKSHVQSRIMHIDGDYAVIFMRSYNQMIVMDTKTYNSIYVQMFILGKYDKSLFELVVSSPYSKIYRVK